MEWIEIRAKTEEEAVERALDALGVHRSELEYTVVQEAKSALFGLKRTEAHIRARVRPMSREKPNDRRRRNRESGGRSRRGGGEARQASVEDTTKAEGTTPRNDAPATAKATTKTRRRSRGGSGGDGGSGGSSKPASGDAAPTTKPVTKPRTEERAMPTESLSVEAMSDAARQFAEGLLDAFDFPGEVDIVTSDDAIDVVVSGQDLGLLVGPKGVTLAAIEELLRDSIGHRAPGIRIHLDVAGYRARRREALAAFANKVAAEVIASGSAKALEPMSAADRKVVHDAVAEIEGVSTVSDGEDPRRRVVIKPA